MEEQLQRRGGVALLGDALARVAPGHPALPALAARARREGRPGVAPIAGTRPADPAAAARRVVDGPSREEAGGGGVDGCAWRAAAVGNLACPATLRLVADAAACGRLRADPWTWARLLGNPALPGGVWVEVAEAARRDGVGEADGPVGLAEEVGGAAAAAARLTARMVAATSSRSSPPGSGEVDALVAVAARDAAAAEAAAAVFDAAERRGASASVLAWTWHDVVREAGGGEAGRRLVVAAGGRGGEARWRQWFVPVAAALRPAAGWVWPRVAAVAAGRGVDGDVGPWTAEVVGAALPAALLRAAAGDRDAVAGLAQWPAAAWSAAVDEVAAVDAAALRRVEEVPEAAEVVAAARRSAGERVGGGGAEARLRRAVDGVAGDAAAAARLFDEVDAVDGAAARCGVASPRRARDVVAARLVEIADAVWLEGGGPGARVGVGVAGGVVRVPLHGRGGDAVDALVARAAARGDARMAAEVARRARAPVGDGAAAQATGAALRGAGGQATDVAVALRELWCGTPLTAAAVAAAHAAGVADELAAVVADAPTVVGVGTSPPPGWAGAAQPLRPAAARIAPRLPATPPRERPAAWLVAWWLVDAAAPAAVWEAAAGLCDAGAAATWGELVDLAEAVAGTGGAAASAR